MSPLKASLKRPRTHNTGKKVKSASYFWPMRSCKHEQGGKVLYSLQPTINLIIEESDEYLSVSKNVSELQKLLVIISPSPN